MSRTNESQPRDPATESPLLTRRQLIHAGVGAGVALGALGSPMLGIAEAAPAPFIRRSIKGMTAADPTISGWVAGINAMKALPATDPRSWTYQAAIHGTYDLPLKTAWFTCQHHNQFFWSWHRMYLNYFERIVRKLSGSPTWALPYWNYTDPTQRTLPAVFRQLGSPLYVAQRDSDMNSGSGAIPPENVDYSFGFSQTSFLSGQTQVEYTPHDDIHGDIGGGPTGLMSNFETAALDPVFWVHHCNIDRLLNLWLAQGDGRSFPSDAAWRNKQFTFFDENAKQVTMTACDVFRAALQLNYTYEEEPPQVVRYCAIRFSDRWKFVKLKVWPFPIPPVTLKRSPRPQLQRLDIRPIRARLERITRNPDQTLLLQLDGVVAARQPAVRWRVFLAPPGARLEAPGPFFVGNLTLFGHGIRGQRHFMPASFTFVADGAVARTLAQGSSLQLTFAPAGILVDGKPTTPRPAAEVRIQRVSFLVENRTRR